MSGFVRVNGAILTAIADALRSKLATYDEAKGSAQIAPAHFANILRSFKVSGTGAVEQDTFDLTVWTHQISESILQEVADELKKIYGTTDLIPLAEYAARIRALVVDGIITEGDYITLPAPTLTLTGDTIIIRGEGAAKFVLCIDGKIVSRYEAQSGSVEISATWAFGIGENITAFSLSESGICSAMSGAMLYGDDQPDDGGTDDEAPEGGGDTGGGDSGGDTHVHAYTVKNTDEDYLFKRATCTNRALYYYSCSCGEKGTEIFSIGDALGHNYVDGVCTRCGATDPNSGGGEGSDTPTKGNVIATYTEDQLFNGISVEDMPALEIGKGYFANDTYFVADGHGYESETGEYTYAAPPSDTIITTEGNRGTPWYDPTYWGVSWDNGPIETRTVTFYEAISGGASGGDTHQHVYYVKNTDRQYLRYEATCTTPATYYYSCSCGEKGTNFFSIGDALGHSYENGLCIRCDAEARYSCPVCGETYPSEYQANNCGKTENCPGYTPETNTGYCEFCGDKLPESGSCQNPDCVSNGGDDNTGRDRYYCTVCGAEYHSEYEASNCGKTENCPGYAPETNTGYCEHCGQKLPEGGSCVNPDCPEKK